MRRAAHALLLIGATLLAECRPASRDPRATLALAPCHLDSASSERIDAQCGTLTVFEDRDAKSGPTIALRVAVVKAGGRTVSPDPLFFLAGGPGEAATESYGVLAGSLARVNVGRDVVLVDQRGTGGSSPLPCPTPGEEAASDDVAAAIARVKECRASLHADLRRYTTAIAMDDLDDVREALGYDRINLYGGSYGTRAALVYLRRHPTRVRSVVLDGVAPPDWALASSFGRDAQRALDGILARCAADDECDRAFPHLPASLASLVAAREPQPVKVTHPRSALPVEMAIARATITSTLKALSYKSETAALLPLLIHSAAVTGDLRPLAAQSLLLHEAMKLSIGMHYAVACSEDAPFLDRASLDAVNGGTYLGSTEGGAYIEACEGWPRAPVSAEDRAPVASDVPVLLLSGELDPVTPPSNAAAAARTLSNSLQITVPGEGHIVLGTSCTARIVRQFIEQAAVTGLSTECLRDAKPMRFFTSFAGPPP